MNPVPKDLEEAFMAFRRSDRVTFCLNDAVEIIAGPHAGRGGAVISLTAVDPNVESLVELSDTGRDVRVLQSDLRSLGTPGSPNESLPETRSP